MNNTSNAQTHRLADTVLGVRNVDLAVLEESKIAELQVSVNSS
jgi:hypothetical protein